MGSSVPAAIDFLVTQAKLLPECADPVRVTDGYPGSVEKWLAIGLDDEETETGELITADFGGKSDLETPVVPCMIRTRDVGTDLNEASSRARAAAFEIFDAVVGMIRADSRLGGVVDSARVSEYRVRQSKAGQPVAGRVCRLYFSVTWRHYL